MQIGRPSALLDLGEHSNAVRGGASQYKDAILPV